MSVTITITDPTEEEARRVADYLMELGGYRIDITEKPTPSIVIFPNDKVLNGSAPSPLTHNPFIRSNPTFIDEHPEIAPEPAVVIPSAPVTEIPTLFTPAPIGAVELDAAGMPWDGRIHSDTKSKIGGGCWRTRRGADPAIVAAVTAELKAAMGAPKAMGAPTVVPAPPATPVPPPFVASAVPSVPPVPTTPVVESVGAAPIASPSSEVPVPPVAIAVTTFPQLMMAITKGIGKGVFTQPDVVKAIEGVGLASIPMLASRPDLIPAVAAALGV